VLISRALSAVVIVGLTALFVYLGGLPFLAFIVTVSAVATYEYDRMLLHRGFCPFSLATVALGVAFVVDAQFGYDIWRWAIVAAVLLPLVWLVAGYRSGSCSREMPQALADWSVSFVGALYVGVPMSHFVLLRQMNQGNSWAELPPGLWWVALVLLGTWAADTGAYLSGSVFGRHGFMTRISRRKTWEGTIGGVLLSLLVVVLMGVFILNLHLIQSLVLGVVIGPAAIVGDLAESVLKRGAGVKDSGSIIPGHGGMLDRIDSMIFTVVMVYYLALVFTRWSLS